jgi:hypothetical protein
MKYVLSIRFIFSIGTAATLLCGCAGPFEQRKTQWTVPEVQTWYANYRQTERHAWEGILYQGSDTQRHHFVARVMSVDNWAIIQIQKQDLAIPDERPYRTMSSAALGYYYVDPSRDFTKIRDY